MEMEIRRHTCLSSEGSSFVMVSIPIGAGTIV